MKTKPTIKRISIEEAQKQGKQLVFVDARSATALARNPTQIPGAIHVPVKDIDRNAKRLPHERMIATYCT
jgi:rhodanese-related sulfurtransferase